MIPADSHRTRRFEIDCRLVVAPLAAGALHAMRVDVDGGLTAGYLTHRHGSDYAVHTLAAQPIMPISTSLETP